MITSIMTDSDDDDDDLTIISYEEVNIHWWFKSLVFHLLSFVWLCLSPMIVCLFSTVVCLCPRIVCLFTENFLCCWWCFPPSRPSAFANSTFDNVGSEKGQFLKRRKNQFDQICKHFMVDPQMILRLLNDFEFSHNNQPSRSLRLWGWWTTGRILPLSLSFSIIWPPMNDQNKNRVSASHEKGHCQLRQELLILQCAITDSQNHFLRFIMINATQGNSMQPMQWIQVTNNQCNQSC